MTDRQLPGYFQWKLKRSEEQRTTMTATYVHIMELSAGQYFQIAHVEVH